MSTYSGLTDASTASSAYTEPPTPSDLQFLIKPQVGVSAGDHGSQPSGHEREPSESSSSVFSVSAYYGTPEDCSEDLPLETLTTLLGPIEIPSSPHPAVVKPMGIPSTLITPPQASPTPLTPPFECTPKPVPSATVEKKIDLARVPRSKLQAKQRTLFGDHYRWPAPGKKSSGASVQAPHPLCPPNVILDSSCVQSHPRHADFNLVQSYPSPLSPSTNELKPGLPTGLAQRRGSPPHAPLLVVPFQAKEEWERRDIESARSALSDATDSSLVDRFASKPAVPSLSSKTMCQVVSPSSVLPSLPSSRPFTAVHPQDQSPSDLHQPRTAATACSQYTFPTTSSSSSSSHEKSSRSSSQTFFHDQDHPDVPVGELFRTLQVWFDQEGFREIAPIFSFDYYNREDDLLYFTTERVGYPFHYTSFQQAPVLRKVVAPDYEEAYVLLEGKTTRNAAGRRDFLSRQASLDMKTAGKYMVEDTEGKGAKWIWRLVYEVEDRKSLMGKPMTGERVCLTNPQAPSSSLIWLMLTSRDVWISCSVFVGVYSHHVCLLA